MLERHRSGSPRGRARVTKYTRRCAIARPGEVVENPMTGKRVTVLETTGETNGDLLRLIMLFNESKDDFYLAGVPRPARRAFSVSLEALAYVGGRLGYRPPQ